MANHSYPKPSGQGASSARSGHSPGVPSNSYTRRRTAFGKSAYCNCVRHRHLYLGATFIESDFRAFGSYRLGNFEVFATSADGMVDHYWRENGGAFVWNGPFRVAENAGGAPSAAYSGAPILDAYGGSYHGESSFWVVWPIAARPRGPGKLGS